MSTPPPPYLTVVRPPRVADRSHSYTAPNTRDDAGQHELRMQRQMAKTYRAQTIARDRKAGTVIPLHGAVEIVDQFDYAGERRAAYLGSSPLPGDAVEHDIRRLKPHSNMISDAFAIYLDREILERALWWLYRTHPDLYRVISLRRFHHMSLREVASELGMNYSTVRRREEKALRLMATECTLTEWVVA